MGFLLAYGYRSIVRRARQRTRRRGRLLRPACRCAMGGSCSVETVRNSAPCIHRPLTTARRSPAHASSSRGRGSSRHACSIVARARSTQSETCSGLSKGSSGSRRTASATSRMQIAKFRFGCAFVGSASTPALRRLRGVGAVSSAIDIAVWNSLCVPTPVPPVCPKVHTFRTQSCTTAAESLQIPRSPYPPQLKEYWSAQRAVATASAVQ